jgi:hypothetical protein
MTLAVFVQTNGFGVGVVSGEIVLDSSNQLSHAGKGAAPDFLAGDLGEKALD